jgi:hypothetical protein
VTARSGYSRNLLTVSSCPETVKIPLNLESANSVRRPSVSAAGGAAAALSRFSARARIKIRDRNAMNHIYYSQRTGSNPHPDGLSLNDMLEIFRRSYIQLEVDGYFTEALGYICVDVSNRIEGEIKDIDLEILLAVRKRDLWPIEKHVASYTEDDLFDMIEFLYQTVSKPIDGTMHSWNDCGMHWTTFNKVEGQNEFRERVNRVLSLYEKRFELSASGEVLLKAEAGFDRIFDADLPTSDPKVLDRVDAAVLRFRRHSSTIDDRRQAVRDLADIFEYLRPKVKALLTSKDEDDLFNIANNFGIRHHNESQKTTYDAVWLNWIFYFYLATVHALVRKIGKDADGMAMPQKRLK